LLFWQDSYLHLASHNTVNLLRLRNNGIVIAFYSIVAMVSHLNDTVQKHDP
jgi:hypothetical protein